MTTKANRYKVLASASESMPSLATPLREVINHLAYPEEFLTAMCSVTAMTMLGYRIRLAAGSAKWVVMDDEAQGDALLSGSPVIPYFGYAFDMVESLPALSRNEFPDSLHVWAVTEDGDIYDFTMESQIQIFKEANNMDWPESTLPPHIISGSPTYLKSKGWLYQENKRACQMVGNMAMRVVILSASPNY